MLLADQAICPNYSAVLWRDCVRRRRLVWLLLAWLGQASAASAREPPTATGGSGRVDRTYKMRDPASSRHIQPCRRPDQAGADQAAAVPSPPPVLARPPLETYPWRRLHRGSGVSPH